MKKIYLLLAFSFLGGINLAMGQQISLKKADAPEAGAFSMRSMAFETPGTDDGTKMSFQGSLLQNGTPFNGPADLSFSIALSDSTSWTETLAGVQVTNGLYSVTLGATNPIPYNLFEGVSEREITVSVDGTNLGTVKIFPAIVKNDTNFEKLITKRLEVEGDNGVSTIELVDSLKSGLNYLSVNPNGGRLQMVNQQPDGIKSGSILAQSGSDAFLNLIGETSTGGFGFMVDLYVSNNSPFGPLPNGYRRGGLDLSNSFGEEQIYLTSFPGDADGSDPDGFSAIFGMRGTNTLNFQLQGNRFENNNLPSFNMFGEHSNGDGWYNRNVAMNVTSDGTNNWGQIELFNTVEGADGETRTVDIDGASGNAVFNGIVDAAGFTVNGQPMGGGMSSDSIAAGIITVNRPSNNDNTILAENELYIEDFASGDFMSLQRGFLRFRNTNNAFSSVFLTGSGTSRLQLSQFDETGAGLSTTFIAAAPTGGYVTMQNGNQEQTVTILADSARANFAAPSGSAVSFGAIDQGTDPALGGTLPYFFMFGDDEGDAPFDVRVQDDGSGDYARISMPGPNSNFLNINGQDGSMSLSGNINSAGALFTRFLNVENENNVPNFIAGTRDFDPNNDSGLGYMAVVGNVFDANISSYRIAAGINSYNNGAIQYADFYQDITASDASFVRPMTNLVYDENEDSGVLSIFDNQLVDIGFGNNYNAMLRAGVLNADGSGYLDLRNRNNERMNIFATGVNGGTNPYDRGFVLNMDQGGGPLLEMYSNGGQQTININGDGGAISSTGDISAGNNITAAGNISADGELRVGDVDGGTGVIINQVATGNVISTGVVAGNLGLETLGYVAVGDNGGSPNISLEGSDGSINAVGNINGATLSADDGFTSSSDSRLKQNVNTIENALVNTQKLRGVTYEWNETAAKRSNVEQGDKKIGLIAQELEKIFPELVKTGADGYKSVDYSSLTAVLIEAIKELNAEVKTLKAENEELKANASKTAELSKRIETIEKLLELKADSSTSSAKQ